MEPVVWQPSLWGFVEPVAVDDRFTTSVRHRLDTSTWVDHAAAWVTGTDTVLDALLAADDPHDVALVGRMRALLQARYGVTFASTERELLGSGAQPIPWRQHASGQRFTNPVVATVTFGARRSLRLRPRGVRGGTTNFVCASGDLLVMGGASQHTWDHSVSRNRRAHGPVMRIIFSQ